MYEDYKVISQEELDKVLKPFFNNKHTKRDGHRQAKEGAKFCACCLTTQNKQRIYGGYVDMAFGKHEQYSEDIISYRESVDLLLHDMKGFGYNGLTKDQLNDVLQNRFSIGGAVRRELDKIFDLEKVNLK